MESRGQPGKVFLQGEKCDPTETTVQEGTRYVLLLTTYGFRLSIGPQDPR